MAKPLIRKQVGYNAFDGKAGECHAIIVGGKNGRRWAPEGAMPGTYATFETRARAEKFIAEGGLIVVEVIPMDRAERESGWVEAEGHSEANIARFRAWTKANGVHLYARPREEFFPSSGIREAQRLGLSKIVMEDLS